MRFPSSPPPAPPARPAAPARPAPPAPRVGQTRFPAAAPPAPPGARRGGDPLADLLDTSLETAGGTDGESSDDEPSGDGSDDEYDPYGAESRLPVPDPAGGRKRANAGAPVNLLNIGNLRSPHGPPAANPRGLTPMRGHEAEPLAALAAWEAKQRGGGRTQQGTVRYAFDRERYRVAVGARLVRRSRLLDSAEVRQHYASRNVPLGMAAARLMTPEQRAEWKRAGLIWVCVPDHRDAKLRGPAFYSHVGKQDRFHHSSLSLGGDVICAGEWIVEGGTLLKISANSGHYRPTLDRLYQAVLHLAAAHAPRTLVQLFDRSAGTYVDRPVLDFVRDASGGGRYTTHESAPF